MFAKGRVTMTWGCSVAASLVPPWLLFSAGAVSRCRSHDREEAPMEWPRALALLVVVVVFGV